MLEKMKDQVFSNVIRKSFDNELMEVGNSLSSMINKYVFLFGNDRVKLLNLLFDGYLNNYDEKTNSFELDFNHILSNVPQDSKDKLFEQIVDKFSKTINITDINKDGDDGVKENLESNDENELILEEQPSEKFEF